MINKFKELLGKSFQQEVETQTNSSKKAGTYELNVQLMKKLWIVTKWTMLSYLSVFLLLLT